MEKEYVLTMDFGTQSLRVSLIDSCGNFLICVKRKYEPSYFSSQSGYAEQDPDYYWNTLVDALKELTSKEKENLKYIKGAALTTFRDSSVQLDENYKPIRNSILWLDQRTAKAKEKLPLLHRIAFKMVGMKDTIELNRRRTIAHWLKENEPDTWSRTRKYVNISGYLTYKLTGNLVDSPSSVTGHYPINFKKRKWYKKGAMKGRIYGIPPHLLCDLVQPGDVMGTISKEVCDLVGLPYDIPVISTGSDKSNETLGLGALHNNVGAISYGTASTIEVTNKRFHNPEKFLPAYPSVVPGCYNMEVQVYRGYWMVGWFLRQFVTKDQWQYTDVGKPIEAILDSKLMDIPPGSDGLVLQPYWGPGLSRPLSKGSIIGFSDVHTREHFYRAIVEGIAYALREGLEGIEFSQKRFVKKLRISGGGSQSDVICQITADVFGLPVSRVQTYETTSLGAAIAVFTALKRFDSYEDAVKKMVRVSSTFYPNDLAHQQYNYLYRHVYLKMFPRLKNIYKDIKNFGKR